jgi:hypothetical protein
MVGALTPYTPSLNPLLETCQDFHNNYEIINY